MEASENSSVMCESDGCNNEAINRVHWPGKDVRLCAVCSIRAHRVARHMGFELSVTPLLQVVTLLCLLMGVACSGSHHMPQAGDAGDPAKLARAGGGRAGQSGSGRADGGAGRVSLLRDAGESPRDAGEVTDPLDAGELATDAGDPTSDAGNPPQMADAGLVADSGTNHAPDANTKPCTPGVDPDCHACPHPVAPSCCSQCQCFKYADGCVERLSGSVFYPATASSCGCQ